MSRPSSPLARWQAQLATNFGTLRGWVRHLLANIAYIAGRYEAHTQLPSPQSRFVFVCLGNINRSAFAAQVARDCGLPAVSIGLATTTGAAATPFAVTQAALQGVNLAAHTATDLSDYRYHAGDVLFVMEARHIGRLVDAGVPREAILLLGYWSRPQRLHLHDPHTLSPAYFSSCFALIESAVLELGRQLKAARTGP